LDSYPFLNHFYYQLYGIIMISSIVFINHKGEILIYRIYKDDITRSETTQFCAKVVATKENKECPIINIDGTISILTSRHILHPHHNQGHRHPGHHQGQRQRGHDFTVPLLISTSLPHDRLKCARRTSEENSMRTTSGSTLSSSMRSSMRSWTSESPR
jgi:hypothetical protein